MPPECTLSYLPGRSANCDHLLTYPPVVRRQDDCAQCPIYICRARPRQDPACAPHVRAGIEAVPLHHVSGEEQR
jgi:hypothetical protein